MRRAVFEKGCVAPTFSNMDLLKDYYTSNIHEKFTERRENHLTVDHKEDYIFQQGAFAKYAEVYEVISQNKGYTGPTKMGEVIGKLYDSKLRGDAVVLDYGCGTGRVAETLIQEYGFKIIDGSDPCKEMLDIARQKGAMRNYFDIGSRDDHSVFSEKSYDLICSTGVFLITPSHPNLDCVQMLSNYVKKGGYIVILTAESYLKIAQFDHVERLQNEGKIKIFEPEYFDRFYNFKEDEKGEGMKGVVLKYQVLL